MQKLFGTRIVLYPPRSPDLTPLDYFLWGHVYKELVYKENPQTIIELKTLITNAIKNIPQETLSRVFQKMKKRAEACISVNRQHFEHLLY